MAQETPKKEIPKVDVQSTLRTGAPTFKTGKPQFETNKPYSEV